MALALKVSSNVPPALAVTVPMVVPPTTRLAPCVKLASVPVAEKTSCALAPPLRASVSVAPLKLLVALSSVSVTVTFESSTTAGPFSVAPGAPSRPLSTGASLTALTVSDTVSVVIENAVMPPLTDVSASPPLLPLVRSQARSVTALAKLPL